MPVFCQYSENIVLEIVSSRFLSRQGQNIGRNEALEYNLRPARDAIKRQPYCVPDGTYHCCFALFSTNILSLTGQSKHPDFLLGTDYQRLAASYLTLATRNCLFNLIIITGIVGNINEFHDFRRLLPQDYHNPIDELCKVCIIRTIWSKK
jgi:hypothetical protein